MATPGTPSIRAVGGFIKPGTDVSSLDVSINGSLVSIPQAILANVGKGPMGSTGPSGPAGVAGPVGAVGPAGVAGVAGPVGAVGPQGSVGPLGAAGPAGVSGISAIPAGIGNHHEVLGYNSDGGGSTTGSNNTSLSRTTFSNLNATASPQAVFANWKMQGGSPEVAGSNTITITAALECPIGGAITRMTFGGVASVVIAPGAQVTSDALPIVIPANTRAGVRTTLTTGIAGSVGTWPRGHFTTVSLGEQAQEGVNLADNSMGGTYSGANGGCYGPIAILGATAVKKPSVYVLGDSLSWGQGDDTTGTSAFPTGDAYGNIGPISRALYAAGIGQVRMTRSGLYARDVVGSVNIRTRYLAKSGTTALVLLGTNDMSGGLTATQIEVYLAELYLFLAAQGLKVIASTLPPHTTSTDSWATTANQAFFVSSGQNLYGGAGSSLATLNNWIRAMPPGVSGVLDYADVVMTARDSGYWNNGYTSDGTHWNQAHGIPVVQAVVANAITSRLII